MPVTPLLINNSRLVTYYNARASNWTVDHPCRRVPWLERTLTMGRRFLWIAHNDGVVCATTASLRNRNGAAAAIAARGLAFARRRLTRDAARRYALRQLLAVVRARAHAPPADPKSAWCRQSLCVTL